MKSILVASLFTATVAVTACVASGTLAVASPHLEGAQAAQVRGERTPNFPQEAKMNLKAKDFCCHFTFITGKKRNITATNRLSVATACVGLTTMVPGTQVQVTSGSC
jgi:hypothetical protein